MKAIHLICAAALSLLALPSCTGDQALPPLNIPEELGNQTIGNGNWNSPLSVYQASLGTIPHDEFGNDVTTCWVSGYIVGWVNVDVSNSNIELGADFSLPATVNTNVLLGATPDETNPLKVATVQLPSGFVRNALNLKDHPENKGQLVTVYGQVGSKYCGAYGVRSVSDYALGALGNEPDPAMVLPSGSLTVLKADLLSGMQGFTFDQGAPSTAGFETWKQNAQYGLVATGGRSGSAVTVEAWAVSGIVDLTQYVSPRLMLHQAANYFGDAANFNDMTAVMVRTVADNGTAGTWTRVEMPIAPACNAWTYSDSGYAVLDDFAGRKIQIGLRYTSTPDNSGTWEIDRVTVTGVYNTK